MSDRIAPRDYFAQVPWSLMDGAPSDVWAVYAVLHRTARGDRQSCMKSVRTIAREAGLGRDRTREILQQLAESAYVYTVEQPGQPAHRRLNTDYPERYDLRVFRQAATPTETGSPTGSGSPTPTGPGRAPLLDSVGDPYRNQYTKQDIEIYKNPPLPPKGGNRAGEGEAGSPTETDDPPAIATDPLTREMTYRATHPRLVNWRGLVDLALDFPQRWDELVVGRQGRFPCYAEPVVDEVLEWLGGLSCYADRTLTRIEARDWISTRLRLGETDRVLGMLDLVQERARQRSCEARPERDPDAEQKAAHAAALEQWRREQEQSTAAGGEAS